MIIKLFFPKSLFIDIKQTFIVLLLCVFGGMFFPESAALAFDFTKDQDQKELPKNFLVQQNNKKFISEDNDENFELYSPNFWKNDSNDNFFDSQKSNFRENATLGAASGSRPVGSSNTSSRKNMSKKQIPQGISNSKASGTKLQLKPNSSQACKRPVGSFSSFSCGGFPTTKDFYAISLNKTTLRKVERRPRLAPRRGLVVLNRGDNFNDDVKITIKRLTEFKWQKMQDLPEREKDAILSQQKKAFFDQIIPDIERFFSEGKNIDDLRVSAGIPGVYRYETLEELQARGFKATTDQIQSWKEELALKWKESCGEDYPDSLYCSFINYVRMYGGNPKLKNISELEFHHFVPDSFGGRSDARNGIALLPKDHALAHLFSYISGYFDSSFLLYKQYVMQENISDFFVERPALLRVFVTEQDPKLVEDIKGLLKKSFIDGGLNMIRTNENSDVRQLIFDKLSEDQLNQKVNNLRTFLEKNLEDFLTDPTVLDNYWSSQGLAVAELRLQRDDLRSRRLDQREERNKKQDYIQEFAKLDLNEGFTLAGVRHPDVVTAPMLLAKAIPLNNNLQQQINKAAKGKFVKKGKLVSIDNQTYANLKIAAEAKGISVSTLKTRIASKDKKWANWDLVKNKKNN